jgi:hypothetical protein
MLTSQWPEPCGTTSCVHCRTSGAYTEIRNSNDTDGPHIWLSVGEWEHLLDSVRAGKTPPGVHVGDHVTLSRVTTIVFSRGEWDAFTAKVRDGDFEPEPADVA